MANQSLINAAQKMYSAKAAKGQMDLEPVLKAADSATDRIVKGIATKRSLQLEESKQQIESFKEILLKNPKLRPQLVERLKDLQEEYFENLKTAEKVFASKKDREDAVRRNNDIAGILRKYETQINSVDLNRKFTTNISESNLLTRKVDDTIIKDKTIGDNIVITDDSINLISATGDEIPLDKFVPLNPIATQSINNLGATLVNAQKEGKGGIGYDGTAVEQATLITIDRELQDDKNLMSMLFDNIGTFNYAKENLKTRTFPFADQIDSSKTEQEQLEDLKKLIMANPQQFRDDFKNDYVASVKSANQAGLDLYNKAERNADLRSKKDYYPNAFNSGTRSFVEGKFKDIKDGFVVTKKGSYKRFDDGFYLLDKDGNKLRPDAAPTSETQLVAEMGMTGYTTEFGFEPAGSDSPEVSENKNKIKELNAQIAILQAEADEAEVKSSGAVFRPTREKNQKILEIKNRKIEELKNQIKELESQE
jgi:hypothetical protein|tara:strand:+ start:13494 stop:14933 length:1440 start_codon:yes stop_codon:yes gene_type:complete